MTLSESQKLMYQPLNRLLSQIYSSFPNQKKIPSTELLNTFLNTSNKNNKLLKFIPQDQKLQFPELGYEQRIYKHGLIATRENNWHDFFNAMVWLMFPKTKSALNAIHFHEEAKQKDNKRSRKRDLLTLFDENGVIVIANKKISELIKNHHWQQLFVHNKELWQNGEIKLHTFGHALYEKYLNPYIGMTAHAIIIENDSETDTNLDILISSNMLLKDKTDLMPLPLLGIPGWHTNQNSEFYNNQNYFRKKS